MSMIGGRTGDRPGGMCGANRSAGLLEAYEDFRNFVRIVSQSPGPEISIDDRAVVSAAGEMKVTPKDYIDAYLASVKVKRILEHPFIRELIGAGTTWQAELGSDEQRLMESDPKIGLEAFFLSTGEKYLVRKRGYFGIVYYFGWYETKPLIMRTIQLLEFGKTSEGYQVVNIDFNQAREAILEYLDLQ